MSIRNVFVLGLFALLPLRVDAALPVSVNLAVPFTSQAPHANWDPPYQEACEEAAALMAHMFVVKKKFVSTNDRDTRIRNLITFQEKQYGLYKDTTAEQTARLIRDRWGHSVDIVKDPTVTRIKEELAKGHPVIIPAAGRQLGNPNFTQPGPLYHMLVIRGYRSDGKFITNDPGTRKGKNYVYSATTLMNAMHDWNGGKVSTGKKVMLVIRP